MHPIRKTKTARPPTADAVQQQERFDALLAEFDAERRHEASGMAVPAERYAPPRRELVGARRSSRTRSTIGTSS